MTASKRVLVIDDEQGVIAFMERLLRTLGYTVDWANDGADGLRKAADPGISLIISDMNMPGEPSSLELVRKLRETRPDCPLVIISGYPSDERLTSCRELGVTEFLTKPFELSFIKGVLNRLFPEKHVDEGSSA